MATIINGQVHHGSRNYTNQKVTINDTGIKSVADIKKKFGSKFDKYPKVQKPNGQFVRDIKPELKPRKGDAYDNLVKNEGEANANAILNLERTGFYAGDNLIVKTISPIITCQMNGTQMVAGKDATLERRAGKILLVDEENVTRQAGGSLTIVEEAPVVSMETLANAAYAGDAISTTICGQIGRIVEVGSTVRAPTGKVAHTEYFSVESEISRPNLDGLSVQVDDE